VTIINKPARAHPAGPLSGAVQIPGDKSISHRALIFGALARGTTTIQGLLESDDVLATANALGALGAKIFCDDKGAWTIDGTGNGAMLDPDRPLDLGNSGTGARLLLGLVTGQGITATFTGDASLKSRPMGRVLEPLEQMGALVEDAAEGRKFPLSIRGTVPAMPLEYRLPFPSAQIKSAILIAGLGAIGRTTVSEGAATRDHTERMLRYFGADITVEEADDGRAISVGGEAVLEPRDIQVPGDPSSAAFPLVAGLLVPDSELLIQNVMINSTRTGLFTSLIEMGAELTYLNERDAGGEPVADIQVAFSRLKGIEIPADRAPSMIDEYPILAVAAACAEGETVMRGLSELRVKECDRLAVTLAGLRANGITARSEGDDLFVSGQGGPVPGGGRVETHLDHRIAMSFLVMGLAADRPVTVDDTSMIATSFPEFRSLMALIGARFEDI